MNIENMLKNFYYKRKNGATKEEILELEKNYHWILPDFYKEILNFSNGLELDNEETFILTVKGDSMINIGIYNGDQIVVEKCNTAENGEIIVALIDDSATVKRFYKENGHIRLQPENDFMDPIIVDDCMILGKVIGLMRWDIS